MSTELREAKVKLVLDTKAALDQAERAGKDDADARERGADQPGGGGEHGGNKPDGTKDRKPSDRGREDGSGVNVPGQLWDAGKAAWGGGLKGHLTGIAKTIPFVGTAVAAAEFAAEYGPMAAAAARRAFGGVIPQIAEGAVVELVRKYNELSARVAAVDATIQQTKQVALLQSKLWGGDVDAAAVGNFAVASYKVNAFLERARLARKMAEQQALGEAVGANFEELYKTLVDGTRLAAGR